MTILGDPGMVNAIQEHHAELVRLCKKFRVRKHEVFGSAATGDGFDPTTSFRS